MCIQFRFAASLIFFLVSSVCFLFPGIYDNFLPLFHGAYPKRLPLLALEIFIFVSSVCLLLLPDLLGDLLEVLCSCTAMAGDKTHNTRRKLIVAHTLMTGH